MKSKIALICTRYIHALAKRPVPTREFSVAHASGTTALALAFALVPAGCAAAPSHAGTTPGAAAVTSSGFNLSDDMTCGLGNTGDRQGPAFNPKLGLLQNNGGPTQRGQSVPPIRASRQSRRRSDRRDMIPLGESHLRQPHGRCS